MRSRFLAAFFLALPAASLAQTDVEWLGRRHGVRPPAAYYQLLRQNPNAFQFSPDNGWIRRGRAVAERRNAGRAQLAEGVWLTPQANVNTNGVLRGTLNVPVLLILFSDTDSAAIADISPQATVQGILFNPDPAPPYSVTTYYREISNDSLEVTGTVQPWRRVSRDDEYYENNNNGLTSRTADLLAEIVRLNDELGLDWGQFDSDGEDGIPNSGDDDGYVDAVVMIHPEVDGACNNSNMWAHKFHYQGWKGSGAVLETSTPATPSPEHNLPTIQIRDYIIQGGRGGTDGCTANQPPAIGLVTHETGHIFGLPDLYNTNLTRSSHGIGEWGLMGSGNWRSPKSPAHMEAWSRVQLGWITEVVVTSDATLDISPIESSDTAYVLPIANSNEYYLLSNRQPIGSSDDKMFVAQPNGAPAFTPGLLVWHVDSSLVKQRMSLNALNASEPEAVRLIQADGRDDLRLGRNRGDGDDSWHGLFGSPDEFGIATTPATTKNDSSATCIVVSQIEQGSPNVHADVAFTVPDLIAANDTLARFKLDAQTMNRFAGCLDAGDHVLEMDATQVVNNGGNRYTWLSWSNGLARSHTFPAGTEGDTIIAQVQTEYLVQVTFDAERGAVTSSVGDVSGAGQFVLKGDPVQLVAEAASGMVFDGWSGDAVTGNATLNLTMTRTYRLTALFVPPLVAVSSALSPGIMGANYLQPLSATGGTGTYTWQVISGALPAGVQLASSGSLTGRPTEAGSFAFDASVTSGSQSQTLSLSLEVTMPTLAVSDVVRQIVGAGTPLTSDEANFLDLLGNDNARLDVGDFLAWVQQTGLSLSASEISAMLETARGGRP
jgi:M6 family metalloprotease-like protein